MSNYAPSIKLSEKEIDDMDRDARIAELEKRLAAKPREAGSCYIVDKAEYNAMKARLADYENSEARYSKEYVRGVTTDCARDTAALACLSLEDGRSISFAAACCVVLCRELEAVEKQVEDLKSSIEWHSNGRAASESAAKCALNRIKEAVRFLESPAE